jgi:2-polyprenyl-3-methyl-5-hydroxy-6-metoxy-1,4-benzoquinol methylase
MNTGTYFDHDRAEVAALLPSGSRHVLEVGCGEGRFARWFVGAESYWGVEPSEAAARVAAERGHRVLHGSWDDVAAALPSRRFDLAVCNDVIEHMAEPEAFLNALLDKMQPGGCIVGSVPNVRYLPHLAELLWQRDWRYRDAGILDRTHLRFFTESSLRRFFARPDLEVEAMVGLNDIVALSPWPGKARWWVMQRLLETFTARSQADARWLQFGFRVRVKD